MGKKGLRLGVSFPPDRLDSDKTLAGVVLAKQFLLRADLVKNRTLRTFWCISKLFYFPLHWPEVLSDIHCEDMVKLLEIKLTKVWEPPCDRVTLKFLTLKGRPH